FAGVILPIVITLIVITLCVFSLVALYRICQKKTPGIWFSFSKGGK
ncbi:Endomucin, partial [Tyto alba]